MLAVLVGAAVLFAQEIDEELAFLGMFFLEADGKRYLARLGIEIVHEQHPIVAPVISHHEHRRVAAGVGLSLLVKPPCGSFDHCIGVRAQLRSGSFRSSPMPSSSP